MSGGVAPQHLDDKPSGAELLACMTNVSRRKNEMNAQGGGEQHKRFLIVPSFGQKLENGNAQTSH